MGTRDVLIEMAARLLDEGGPAAVTLRDVARLAGVSHNAPYKHFADKEALLAAVATRELAGRRTVLVALAERDQPAEARLRAAVHDHVAWALDRPARFKLTFGRWTTGDPDLIAAAHAARAMLIEIVAHAQAAGALPPGDPARLAALVHATAHGAADLAVSAGGTVPSGPGPGEPAWIGPDELVGDLLDYLTLAAGGTRSRRRRLPAEPAPQPAGAPDHPRGNYRKGSELPTDI
jgi:AcrR family transcriptional regulator